LLALSPGLVAYFSSATQISDADIHPVVRGKRGVVAGGHPLSVEAGLRLLQHGGTRLMQAWLPYLLLQSLSSLTFFRWRSADLIKLRGNKSNGVVVIEGMGQAPMKATREFFVKK